MFLSLLLTLTVLILHSWRFPAASTNSSTFNPLLLIFSLASSNKLLLGRPLLRFFVFQRFSLALGVDCPPVFVRSVRDRTMTIPYRRSLEFSSRGPVVSALAKGPPSSIESNKMKSKLWLFLCRLICGKRLRSDFLLNVTPSLNTSAFRLELVWTQR